MTSFVWESPKCKRQSLLRFDGSSVVSVLPGYFRADDGQKFVHLLCTHSKILMVYWWWSSLSSATRLWKSPCCLWLMGWTHIWLLLLLPLPLLFGPSNMRRNAKVLLLLTMHLNPFKKKHFIHVVVWNLNSINYDITAKQINNNLQSTFHTRVQLKILEQSIIKTNKNVKKSNKKMWFKYNKLLLRAKSKRYVFSYFVAYLPSSCYVTLRKIQ